MNKSNYRERCLGAKGEQCTICNSSENVIVHHVGGDRENNSLGNLEPICRDCHAKIHNYHDGYEVWWQELPGGTVPAFPYSEVEQKMMYARDETWEQVDETIEDVVIPILRENGMTNIQKREVHTAIVRLASEQSDEVAEQLLEARRQT